MVSKPHNCRLRHAAFFSDRSGALESYQLRLFKHPHGHLLQLTGKHDVPLSNKMLTIFKG
jgi:hypothetical protein